MSENFIPVPEGDDPFALFEQWFAEAQAKEPRDANAMALATVRPDGRPSVRVVLMKGWDRRGFAFYTNLESRKGEDLAATPHACANFHWKSQDRQIRIDGSVEPVTAEEADAYFASRPRDSQLSAWASQQSRLLESRALFEERLKDAAARFEDQQVARPPFWSGYRILPSMIEFWAGHPYRQHDRARFRLDGGKWLRERLYP